MQSHIRGMHYKGAYHPLILKNWQCICLHKKYTSKQSIVRTVIKVSECVKALSIVTVSSPFLNLSQINNKINQLPLKA